jgi:hypothetical protein
MSIGMPARLCSCAFVVAAPPCSRCERDALSSGFAERSFRGRRMEGFAFSCTERRWVRLPSALGCGFARSEGGGSQRQTTLGDFYVDSLIGALSGCREGQAPLPRERADEPVR